MRRNRPHVVNTVLHYLGAVLVITILGILLLTYQDKEVPGILTDTVDIVVIAMVGLMSIGPKNGEPQEVRIAQPAGDPVPVEEQPPS